MDGNNNNSNNNKTQTSSDQKSAGETDGEYSYVQFLALRAGESEVYVLGEHGKSKKKKEGSYWFIPRK